MLFGVWVVVTEPEQSTHLQFDEDLCGLIHSHENDPCVYVRVHKREGAYLHLHEDIYYRLMMI